MSQPPLTAAIKQLEDEVGATLFERSTKKVALTPAGAAFYPEALKILAQLNVARSTARRVAAGAEGVLRLGFVGGMLVRGMPDILRRFSVERPGVAVLLREQGSTEQIRSITAGRIDGGFLHLASPSADIGSMPIYDEPFVCCVGEDDPLAFEGVLDVARIRGADMVMFAREISPTYYDSVLSMCSEAGFSPNIRYEVAHWMTAVALVARGMGVALIPQSFATLGLHGVRFLPLRDIRTSSQTHFAWRADASNPILSALVAHLRQGRDRSQMTVDTEPGDLSARGCV